MKKPSTKAKPKTATLPAIGLFAEAQGRHTVKAIADRAEQTSLAERSRAEANRQAVKSVDLKPLPDPTTADEYMTHAMQWLAGMDDHKAIRKRWDKEVYMRTGIDPELTTKQMRLLAASFDGRCRRLGEK